MPDIYPPIVQRPALLKLAQIIDSRAACLRRDECGDWTIFGKHGHIFAVPEGFQLFVLGKSTRGWNIAKDKLSFCRICNDGDDEGGFFLERLPTVEEGQVLREVLGIPKARHLSEEQKAKLTTYSFRKSSQPLE